MAKTVYEDTADPTTIVTAAVMNALNTHRHMGLDQDGDGAIDYAADTGAANAYVVALTPALPADIVGMPVRFRAAHANTGASTINVSGTVRSIKKQVNQALAAGDILAGEIVEVIWDGTNYQYFPAAVNADWGAAGGPSQILNKPALASVATTGSYNDLANKPSIPTFIGGAGYAYEVDPTGQITQWFTVWYNGGTFEGYFPFPFPNVCTDIFMSSNGLLVSIVDRTLYSVSQGTGDTILCRIAARGY